MVRFGKGAEEGEVVWREGEGKEEGLEAGQQGQDGGCFELVQEVCAGAADESVRVHNNGYADDPHEDSRRHRQVTHMNNTTITPMSRPFCARSFAASFRLRSSRISAACSAA